jgi:DNA-binding beta-propeller fold protein YncE
MAVLHSMMIAPIAPARNRRRGRCIVIALSGWAMHDQAPPPPPPIARRVAGPSLFLVEVVTMRFRSTTLVLAALLATPAVARAQRFHTTKYDIGGDGGTDYLTADPATGRVYVSRATHVMIVDGATGKVIGDIPNTPRVHGIAFAPKWNHGFTTNGGDSTSTMFDSKTMRVIKRIDAGKDGLDGIMYDDASDKILTIDHSRPVGTAVVIDAKTGDVEHTVELSGTAPEGGVSDGKGRLYINIENKNAIDVIDTKTWTRIATWAIDPCDGPTGIAMDRATNRIFSGCSTTSVVVDAATGKVVARITNGEGVDALGWDQAQKLMYIPAGRDGNVTVVHEDAPDTYTVVATVPTMVGAKTITVDPKTHAAYVFTPEYGPAPAGATVQPQGRGRGRGPARPVIGAWFIAIVH